MAGVSEHYFRLARQHLILVAAHPVDDVGAGQEIIFTDVWRVGVGSSKNHVGASALVLVDSCYAPATYHLARRAMNVGEPLAGAEGELGELSARSHRAKT